MNLAHFRNGVAALLALSAVLFDVSAFAAGALLESSSEGHTSPSIVAPRSVIELVLPQDSDDAQIFAECMKSERLSLGEEQKLFLVSEVDLNLDSRPDYFVRPSLEPWCSPYYGAHLFRYWFIVSEGSRSAPKYRVLIASGGDGVKVLESVTNGWRDLETVGNTAVTSTRMTWKMRNGTYQRASCTVSEFKNGKVVAEKPCDV